MGPRFAQDFGEDFVLACCEIRNLFQLANCGLDQGVREPLPGLYVVRHVALELQIGILGEVPRLPGFAEILGVDLEPGPEVDREAVRQLDRHDDSNEEADALDRQERVVAPRLEQLVANLEDHVGQPEGDRQRATPRIRGDTAAGAGLDPGLTADLDAAGARHVRLSHLGGSPTFAIQHGSVSIGMQWGSAIWYSADQVQVRDADQESLDSATVRKGDRDFLVVAGQFGGYDDAVAEAGVSDPVPVAELALARDAG